MDFSDLFSSIDFLGIASAIFSVTAVICFIALYILKSVCVYFLSLRTKQKHAWMAFVPILQDMKVFNMAGLSSKVFVIFYCVYRALFSAKLEWGILAPIWWIGVALYAAGMLYARYQTAKNFGCTNVISILNAFFEPFVLLYIVCKKLPHQYTPQYVKVDTYLKAYGLYEDPTTFADPNAKPEPTFGKAKQQVQNQQPQNTWEQNEAQWYPQNAPQNFAQNPIQINTEKENSTINLNMDK